MTRLAANVSSLVTLCDTVLTDVYAASNINAAGVIIAVT